MAFWATQAELEAKILTARLKNWGDKDRDGTLDAATLTLAFQEAQAICSSYLIERFGGYLSAWTSTTVPWLIKSCYLDLAVWFFATGSNTISPTVQKRYETSLDTLKRIHDGELDIYNEQTGGILTEVTLGFSDTDVDPETDRFFPLSPLTPGGNQTESVVFTPSDHNSLTRMQGGATGEYYHLTATQHANQQNAHAPVTVTDTTTIDLTLLDQALSAEVKPDGIGHSQLANLQGGTTGELYHLTAAQSAQLHAPVTVTDTSTVDLTLTGQAITADVKEAGLSLNNLGEKNYGSLDGKPTIPTTFLALNDTPASYTGQAGLVAKVKATEDGIEFAAGGGGVTAHSALTQLDYAHAGHTGFESTVTKGNLTAGSNKIAIGGTGTGAVIGAGASVDVTEGNLTHNNLGGLNSGDYQHLSAAQVSALHPAVTITDTNSIDLSLTGQALTADIKTQNTTYIALAVDASGLKATASGLEPTLTKGNLSEVTSSVLTVTGGTGAIIGSGVTLEVKQASGSQAGYLSITDWTTFNGKQAALSLGNLTAGSTKISIGGTGTGAVIGAGASVDVAEGNLTHNNLGGLTTGDPHTQYALLAGRAGGQTLNGGTAAGDDLTLLSSAHATKGNIFFGTSTYDEVNNRLGIGTLSPDTAVEILATSEQLRLTHTDATKFCSFTLDTNHDLTIKPSSTGQIILQPTTDSADFFQVLDADGGTPVFNVDATNERVGIGTASPSTTLNIIGNIKAESNSNTTGLFGSASDTPAVRAYFSFQRSRGTLASPSAVQDGDSLGTLYFYGYQNSDYRNSASINNVCDGSPSGDYVPGRFVFALNDAAGGISYHRMMSTGYVGINSTPDARFEVETTTTDGQQAITIDQNDADQAFVDFQGTSAANANNNLSTWTTAALNGYIKVEINGTAKWLAYYNAPTS